MERRAEGYTQHEIADFLGVTVRTVQRWDAAMRTHGDQGLEAKPVTGRPPKLTAEPERIVLSWFRESPTIHGFAGELWTGRRVAEMIERHFGVRFHPHYVNHWLTRRGITPQKPRKRAAERDEARIDAWIREDWPRILKKGLPRIPMSF